MQLYSAVTKQKTVQNRERQRQRERRDEKKYIDG